jgi:hypothetical protein
MSLRHNKRTANRAAAGAACPQFRLCPLFACLAVFVNVPMFSPCAEAMVGGGALADRAVARHVALIVGSRGTSCTGVVIARDLVLTAAHCALPGADYKIVEFDRAHRPSLRDIASVAFFWSPATAWRRRAMAAPEAPSG